MSFSLGLAIWGYKGWLGELFPAKAAARDFLKLYSRRFSIVEGNTTFYSIPDRDTVKRWAAETPEGFLFFPKLPKTVTHEGNLLPHLPDALRFLALMQGLGDRLGVMFLQLPPSYSPAYYKDLELFIQGWQAATAAPLAVEVRHIGWFQASYRDRLNELLTHHQVGRVLLDTRAIYRATDNPQQYSQNKKPDVPLDPIVTAPFSFVRYISHPVLENNLDYFAEWVDIVANWVAQGKQTYFFVHCPLEDHSPRNARRFQAMLEQAGLEVPPLPWNLMADETPSQLSLF
ncbi:DUF72 domain-containing protein [Alkalinema sp. FACHB-956]|uniref:DUF72 domain-containing protein n=1 Tax=Alkalinema sp. FACHB-956 TaxID=2692768 RepID=UPI001686B8BE|nr:DUF72 domain-containing protein [Alkalinema sp. FACHB-956]MBD2329003.1 DUF72 domain-containing protein [Alkalinema sp. FACHB-956]